MKSKVSIIIPTYNRAHLLNETLDSIIKQTYKNWECIVVDDDSRDDTLNLLGEYNKRDSRILYYKRPFGMPKGANACRNYGFKMASGEYIIWFDSDDLMTKDHLQVKVKGLENGHLDFVISKTANFKDGNLLQPYEYVKKPYGIKSSDFILLKIHWYTYDVLLKREVAEKISWNEKMKSWQDYNYFCKMLLNTEKGEYIDEVLTHRRLHDSSIQRTLTKNAEFFKSELLENRIYTYKDIHDKISWKTKKELIYGMMNLCFEIAKSGKINSNFQEVKKTVKNELGLISAGLFYSSIYFSLILKKGYFLLEKSKKRDS